LLSMLLITGILTSAIYAKQKCPLYSLGVFWFFGGHLLESTVIPLELMYLHRNYLPSIGIFLVLTEVGLCLYKNYRILTVIAALIFLLSFSICTRFLAYQWSDDYSMMIVEAMHNPKSIRANFKAGQTLKYYAIVTPPGKQKDEFKTKAIEYFKRIEKLKNFIAFKETGDNRFFNEEAIFSPIIRFLPTPFGFLFALGLPGLILLTVRNRIYSLPIIIAVTSVTATFIILVATARFRTHGLPLFAVGIGVFITAIIDWKNIGKYIIVSAIILSVFLGTLTLWSEKQINREPGNLMAFA